MIKGNLEKIAKLLKRRHLARLSVDKIAELIKRSNGKCYLCNENLNFEKEIKKIEGDKKDPSETLSIENLYLAHEQCNNDKKDQPVSLARIKIAFKKFYEKKDEFITFDEFLDEYVENNRKSIKVKTLKDKLVLKFRDEETILPFFTDPTTKVKYCFGEISISYLFNDKDVQPRPIDKTHLFKLVDDFQSHPVHEPSNCRLITKKELNENYIDAELLQFDGQHKSAAQVLLGREFLPFKIYINPEIKMIRELVVIIQNEIKKKAVLESIIIKRMKAAYQDRWNGYLELSGEHSEAGLIDSLPAREKNLAKKELKNAIYDNIIENSRLKLTEFLSKGKTKGERKRPVSINLLKQILDSFLYTKPSNLALETKKDVREIEAENVVFF